MIWCFISFQSDSPGVHLNALGLYLLVSLFFVMGTTIELAIVLLMKRIRKRNLLLESSFETESSLLSKAKEMDDSDNPNQKVFSNGIYKSRKKIKMDEIISFCTNPSLLIRKATNKIDFAAFIIFLSFYIIFNFIYFVKYT